MPKRTATICVSSSSNNTRSAELSVDSERRVQRMDPPNRRGTTAAAAEVDTVPRDVQRCMEAHTLPPLPPPPIPSGNLCE
ncbi:unnamed protein product [Trichogramma brassicae]|uniref:Uncharacterized protein n=1 Tax=Trichogramma brassicae TaxID=86971 RepID=A0A6H5IGN9_9HYME|nr:unnamed protein product [Trichogramma brassicae]